MIDIVISLVLFGLSMLIFEMKKHKQLKGYNSHTSPHKLKIHFTLHAFIGIYFAFTYFAFRTWHTPWYFFSFLHGYALVATLIMPFALAYLVKGTNKAKTVALVLSGVLLLSPITRPFILWGDEVSRTALVDFEYAIPFNICNISALVYILALLLPKQHIITNTLKNYMITLGFFGGLINNIQTHNGHVNYFWYYFNWESYIVHALIMIIPMFMVLTGQIKVSKKYISYNLTWLIPTYLFLGFVLNPWIGFNYWFTSPIEFLSALPGQTYALTLFATSVYPIYMTVLFCIILLAFGLLYAMFKWMEQYLTPYFTAQSPLSHTKAMYRRDVKRGTM